MGIVKKKHERRSVDFFIINCGFKRPFKVLLDGNFVHAALHLKIDLEKMMRGALSVPSKEKLDLFITQCALHELHTLSDEFQDACSWAETNAQIHHCRHARGTHPPDECLRDCLRATTSTHYFVATQDSALRDSLGQDKAGATLFVSANGIQLSAPTAKQRRLADQDVKESMEATAAERKSPHMVRPQNRVTTSSKFKKKKKARGPNPLSVKKKSKATPTQAANKERRKQVGQS